MGVVVHKSGLKRIFALGVHIMNMCKKTLANTNPHLRGKSQKDREALAARSTITSTGVEGVKVDLSEAIDIPRRPKRFYKSSG